MYDSKYLFVKILLPDRLKTLTFSALLLKVANRRILVGIINIMNYTEHTTERLSLGLHTFKCPSVTLTYTVKGQGPLLVIQAAGWGISSRYLQIGLAALESHFILIFPEPRGSGKSDRPENLEEMSSADMADDLERLRVYLDLPTIDLLGHSNGGQIVLDYAERYPEKVRNLVILTHWLTGYDDSAEWNRFISERRNNPLFIEAVTTIEGSEPDEQEDWYQYMLKVLSFYVFNPPLHFQVFAKAMGIPSLWVYRAQLAADERRPIDLYANLHKVKAKTLCLGCDEDPICTANVTRVTHEGIKGSELVIIKNCGHFPWIEKPEDFFDVVMRFFRDR